MSRRSRRVTVSKASALLIYLCRKRDRAALGFWAVWSTPKHARTIGRRGPPPGQCPGYSTKFAALIAWAPASSIWKSTVPSPARRPRRGLRPMKAKGLVAGGVGVDGGEVDVVGHRNRRSYRGSRRWGRSRLGVEVETLGSGAAEEDAAPPVRRSASFPPSTRPSSPAVRAGSGAAHAGPAAARSRGAKDQHPGLLVREARDLLGDDPRFLPICRQTHVLGLLPIAGIENINLRSPLASNKSLACMNRIRPFPRRSAIVMMLLSVPSTSRTSLMDRYRSRPQTA